MSFVLIQERRIKLRAILWICIGVINIITSALWKDTHESRGKTAYWDGVLCGANAVMILMWILKLCGLF